MYRLEIFARAGEGEHLLSSADFFFFLFEVFSLESLLGRLCHTSEDFTVRGKQTETCFRRYEAHID